MSTATATIDRAQSAAITERPASAKARLAALDGLRGVACLIVLVHHTFLTIPVLSAASADPVAAHANATPLELAITWSPLHILWEGAGAVWVFFVLSGYVLVRQVKDPTSFDWVAYYPQRLARLYLPVLAAVGFAVILIAFFGDADHGTASSAWMERRANDVSLRGILFDSTLLGGAGYTASPLWSLQWEVWFSLLLPLFVVAVRPRAALRRPIWIVLTIPLAVVATVVLGGGEYLAVFLIGAILAGAHDRIEAIVERLTRARWSAALFWGVSSIWVLVMLPARWTLAGIAFVPTWMYTPLSISAAGIVLVMALHWRTVAGALTAPVFLWFGAVSFSLYLVHEPIVVTLAKVLGDDRLWIALPLGVALAVAVAAGFWFVIERPATALSRIIGRAIHRRGSIEAPVG